uniref:Uncharacterized protein n=1 Tax=Piliocolobus tephrosceles TaxID=591936 RepID=A0A8C9HBI9_9PRIM
LPVKGKKEKAGASLPGGSKRNQEWPILSPAAALSSTNTAHDASDCPHFQGFLPPGAPKAKKRKSETLEVALHNTSISVTENRSRGRAIRRIQLLQAKETLLKTT